MEQQDDKELKATMDQMVCLEKQGPGVHKAQEEQPVLLDPQGLLVPVETTVSLV